MTDIQRTLIRGGHVVTSTAVIEADVLVEGQRIAGLVAPGASTGGGRIVDATGCFVLPGVIDAHTHIMLDTGIYKTVDNWEVGTRAAAFGGVTTVIDFANQIKGRSFKEALDARLEESADAVIDYTYHMVILEPSRQDGALRADLRAIRDLGMPSIKLFTTYRPNYFVDDATILRIFHAMPDGMIAMVHCENDSIVTDATTRLVEAGQTSWQFHGVARPESAEAEAVHRVLYLASLAQARVYVAHCSTAMAVSEVNRMRGCDGHWDGVFGETCPQYLLLNDDEYSGEHAERFILQPPLRRAHHAESLKHYVAAGMIDVLSTDSCDYSLEQKLAEPEFVRTPGGLPGIETLLPLMYTNFHDRVPLTRMMQMLSENPARLFGLYPRKGTIQVGSDADLVIYDPEPVGTIRHEDMHYLAGYSPFEGQAIQGKVKTVLSRGEIIVDSGEFLGHAGRGRFVAGGASIDPR